MRAALLVVAVTACGGHPQTTVIPTNAPAEYPGTLRDPKTIADNFMVRQTITVHAKRDGKPAEGELDAVLQKQGDSLLILGFGPMNVKAFTITQRADRIEFVQYMGPHPPFSPRNVVVDVHRVFFMHLPAPATPKLTGTQEGELDGEHVVETYQDGELRGAVFTRPGSTFKGAIRVELGSGCVPGHCEPDKATLHNEWFDYTLAIANEEFQAL